MDSVFRPDVLAGKVAFITGGGTGICRGIAEAFASHGAQVAITSRKLDHLAPTAAEIEAQTGQVCLPVVADVRDPKAVEAAVDATLERFGRIDLVVNGAAGNFLAAAASLSHNAFRTVMEIDTLGTWHVSKTVFDKYLKDHGGHIINISATLHYAATPMQIHVSAAKSAIDAMTRNLAVEWGPLGIRVNGIAPGPIGDTEGMRRLAPGEWKDKLEQRIPVGRFGTIREIADTALFLATPAASYFNGTTLIVDGGHWLVGTSLTL